MRAKALVVLSGLVMAVLAGTVLQEAASNSDPPVVAACTVQGEACEPTLGGGRQSVLHHRLLTDGCEGADLHIVRYTDGDSPALVAAWCD